MNMDDDSSHRDLPVGASPDLVLGLDAETGGSFTVDANLIATGRTCVIGASGSGKSYAVGVICEELCKNQVPFVLVDTEGEYSGLKEKYEVIWVGDAKESDVTWDGLDLDSLAAQAPEIAPIILDVSETELPNERINGFFTSLYREVEKKRVPYLAIVEEADKFIPQTGTKLQIFSEIARRGRKRGLGLMICTQRPSLVDKNVLSQCGNQLIGKLVIQNDLEAVSQFFSGRQLPKQLTSLTPGTFYALGGLSPVPRYVKMRLRETRHGGVTPELASRVVRPYIPAKTSIQGKPKLGSVGIAPRVSREEIPARVRRLKSYLVFGKQESVTEVLLVFRTLVQVGVRARAGVLTKRYETKYATLEGGTGRFVTLGSGIGLHEGFQRLLGLDDFQVRVLMALRPDRDASVIDVARGLRTSEGEIRRAFKILEERSLVKSTRIGRVRTYRRLVDVPSIAWSDRSVPVEAVSTEGSTVEPVKVKESEVRDVIRGLRSDFDLESFQPFVYPLYKVTLTLDRKTRVVMVDATNGQEVNAS